MAAENAEGHDTAKNRSDLQERASGLAGAKVGRQPGMQSQVPCLFALPVSHDRLDRGLIEVPRGGDDFSQDSRWNWTGR
jgi:hypothetical protein